jgi:hypothetical protein
MVGQDVPRIRPMKSVRLIGLAVAALGAASSPVSGEPQHPSAPADLKVITRTINRAPENHSVTNTQTLYVKGARLRSDITVRMDEGESRPVSTTIMRCDERRVLLLNPDARTYALTPALDASDEAMSARVTFARPLPRGADVEITIDAVDTGERRSIGSYEARHVITTRKFDPSPGAQTPRSETVTDGWYIDVPAFDCATRTDSSAAFLIGYVQRDGSPPDSFHLNRLGTARTGYAIAEIVRYTAGGRTSITKTALVEASDAPLASTVFDVPDGYRPALPLPGGGFDLGRADTIAARVGSYCDIVADWVQWVVRRIR